MGTNFMIEDAITAASNVQTGTVKEGYVTGVDAPHLKGLPTIGDKQPAYTHLTLADKNLSIVELRGPAEASGAGNIYVQSNSGGWREVKYDDIAGIIADYKMATGETPSASALQIYLDDPKQRRGLSAAANQSATDVMLEPERRAIEDDLRKRSGNKDLTITIEQFRTVYGRINDHISGLGLPVNSANRSTWVSEWFRNEIGVTRSMIAQSISFHPGLEAIIRAEGKNPATISIEEMKAAIKKWHENRRAVPVPPDQPTPQAMVEDVSKLNNEQVCLCYNDYIKTIWGARVVAACRKTFGENCLNVKISATYSYLRAMDMCLGFGTASLGGKRLDLPGVEFV